MSTDLLKLAAVIEIDRLREQNKKLRQQVKKLKRELAPQRPDPKESPWRD